MTYSVKKGFSIKKRAAMYGIIQYDSYCLLGWRSKLRGICRNSHDSKWKEEAYFYRKCGDMFIVTFFVFGYTILKSEKRG